MNAGRRLVGGWSEVGRALVGRRSSAGRRSVGGQLEVEVGRGFRSDSFSIHTFCIENSRAPASELVLQRGGLPSEITLGGGGTTVHFVFVFFQFFFVQDSVLGTKWTILGTKGTKGTKILDK